MHAYIEECFDLLRELTKKKNARPFITHFSNRIAFPNYEAQTGKVNMPFPNKIVPSTSLIFDQNESNFQGAKNAGTKTITSRF